MSYQNDQKKINKLVSEHFEKDMPERIRRLASIATMDLYFGPYPPDHEFEGEFDWPGFCGAVDEIKPWIESNIPSDLWVDLDCECVMTKEPEGYFEMQESDNPEDNSLIEVYIEPFLECIYHLHSFKEVTSCIFNKELINTIW